VLLVRPRYSTGLSRAATLGARIVTEPLALEYLAAVANEEQCAYHIHDPTVTRRWFARELREFRPDIVAITGYYAAKDSMLEYARRAKARSPGILTLIGGVHAEINYEDFYDTAVDLVAHSGGAETFRRILRAAAAGDGMEEIDGTCHRDHSGLWHMNRHATVDLASLPRPDRTHFYRHIDRFNYLNHGPVAMVKTAYGCPYRCSFCYCRLLNDGAYTTRPLEDVVDEIASIDCDRIWVIDDTFLIDPERIAAFAELLEKTGVRKQFIVYSRADFIAGNPGMLPTLKRMGIMDVIVGFEAIDNAALDAYEKGVGADENLRCVRLLKNAGIECTGLFIMDIDATRSDFARLNRWIAKAGLTTCALSVFCPIPGTQAYEEYRDRLTTTDCRKWDLLHLVLRPTRLNRLAFYLLMMRTYVRPFIKHSTPGRSIAALLPHRERSIL
jgi:radical SAM superfamily enzyme YgiQ (UPF0313 family)